MELFRDFEKEVLELLLGNALSKNEIDEIIKSAKFISYEYTGSGYFFEIGHPKLSEKRVVYSNPLLMGNSDGIECGFVIFIENRRLIIECHSWGELEIPEDFRNRKVDISEEKMN